MKYSNYISTGKGESAILNSPIMDLNRPESYILIPPQNPAIDCIKKSNRPKILGFISKSGGLIVCFQNKYTIISINSPDSIKARHPQFEYLQNIEDLHMHYTIEHFANYGK